MHILADGLKFPEGPVILADGSLAVVEMARETLTRILPDGRAEVVAHVPGGPNGAAVGPEGTVYICNNGGFSWIGAHGTLRTRGVSPDYKGGSIEIVDPDSGRVERLYDSCDGHSLRGPNDLVFDRHGGFWFTDYGKRTDRAIDRGFVYWARADGSEIREVIGPMLTPNGVGLSPDGATLYVSETETGRLWAWEVVGPGEVRKLGWPAYAGATLVAALDGHGRFDSLAVTAAGNVCVAALERCAIAVVAPDTGQISLVPAPDLQVTNLCFGGPDGRTAFMTFSHRGCVAVTDWGEPGLALAHQGF